MLVGAGGCNPRLPACPTRFLKKFEKVWSFLTAASRPRWGPPIIITQSVSSPRHHNAIQLVSFKTVFLKNLRVIPGIPSLFKLGHISHSAVLLYVQNRFCVSDAPTIKWDLSLLKAYHLQSIRQTLTKPWHSENSCNLRMPPIGLFVLKIEISELLLSCL